MNNNLTSKLYTFISSNHVPTRYNNELDGVLRTAKDGKQTRETIRTLNRSERPLISL